MLLDILRELAKNLKQSTESDKDLPERLNNIRRLLEMFSLEELHTLSSEVQSEDTILWY